MEVPEKILRLNVELGDEILALGKEDPEHALYVIQMIILNLQIPLHPSVRWTPPRTLPNLAAKAEVTWAEYDRKKDGTN